MLVRFFSVAVLLALVPATPAFAQDPAPATPRLTLDLQSPNGGRLSLPESIAIALSRNPALTIERMRLDAAAASTEAERGNMEPLLNVSQASFRRDNVVASRFYPTGLYIDSENASRVSVESKTFLGGSVSAGLDYRKLTSSSNIQTLSPQYSTNLVQPTWTNLGSDAD